jgi:hypothetical protein
MVRVRYLFTYLLKTWDEVKLIARAQTHARTHTQTHFAKILSLNVSQILLLIQKRPHPLGSNPSGEGAWMSVCCQADHSSRGVLVCKWGDIDPPGAVTPNKIQCRSQWPLARWDREFEFQQGMDVCYRSDHSYRGVVCELGSLDRLEAVTPNKIQCRSEWPLADWDRGFEFKRGMGVSLFAG